jgi:F0F1-type ATP synthase beta subunit
VIAQHAHEDSGEYDKAVMRLLLMKQQVIVKKVKEILSKDKELEKIINLLGIDTTYTRTKSHTLKSHCIEELLYTAIRSIKEFSGQDGERVPIWASLFGCLALCVHISIGDFTDKQLPFSKGYWRNL